MLNGHGKGEKRLSFKIYTVRPELFGKIDRRDLIKLGAAMGGAAMLPNSAWANDYPPLDADNPPSANRETPEANLGGQFERGLLPGSRLLLYYGFPGYDTMGILGEYEPEELLPILEQQRQEYVDVSPDNRPWRIGFELIASVAQRDPQPDNSYVADTNGRWLDKYTIFTHENNMELVMDVQMGRRLPHEDYEGLERWMRFPHVHLAIDPEFHLPKDGTPGIELGKIHADDISRAQDWLIGLADKYGTPRKILIVHQFNWYSIEEKSKVAPKYGVDLVLNADGWGTPEQKLDTYDVLITQQPIEYNGFKVFYKQDLTIPGSRLMTPEDVMNLNPIPDVVNYQ